MVHAADQQFNIRQPFGSKAECLDHRLQPLVGTPLAECKNAMRGIAAFLKRRIFRTSGENAVLAHVYHAAPIFLVQNFPIRGEQNGNRIREQNKLRGKKSAKLVNNREANLRVLQVHGFHQLVQCNVRVETVQAHQRRQSNAHECGQRLAAEASKRQIEPNYIWLELPDCPEQTARILQAVKSPAANHVEFRKLALARLQIVAQDGQIDPGNFLQLVRDVEAVFVERLMTRRKRRYQANVHEFVRVIACRESLPSNEKYCNATRTSALLLPECRVANWNGISSALLILPLTSISSRILKPSGCR
jgi:hypothetical protein